DARAIEHAPLRLGNRALVADRECGQYASVRRLRQWRRDARANALACTLHVVAGASGKAVDPEVRRIVPNVAGCAKVVLEQPRLEVEAVRIDVAVRPLEPKRQGPALA